MMMYRRLFVLVLMLWRLDAATIRVALAANVSYAMPELIHAFHRHHPAVRIQTTVGGSGKLATQIEHGAPYDLFLSANLAYPQKLYAQGSALHAPRVYAQGALAYLSNTPRDFSRGMALLRDPSIKKIAVANPRTAPYGQAAFQAMKTSGVLEAVRAKFVFGESIAQTVTYAVRAADIGIVAQSALYAPQMARYRHGRNWQEVSARLYHPIDQGMVMLRRAAKRPAARLFYDFLLAPESRAILKRFGYRVP